jgi:predicted acetyltransferase
VNTRTAAPVANSLSSRPLSIFPPLAASRSLPGSTVTPRLTPAKAGDHQAIHRLLLAAFHGPALAEFHAQLDVPGYDAADRLVVKYGEHVAAHLRADRRAIHVAGVPLPAVRIMDLATSAEFRGLGFASTLVAAAERRAREQGVVVALTRTRAASLFARQGWSVCGRHVFSTAGARQILAQLQATSEGLPAPPESDADRLRSAPQPPVVLRPLRRIELPAVMRLYEQSLTGHSGSPVRSEAYWEWLLNRGSCDRIYVASAGGESGDLRQQLAAICGAVFIQKGRIVELLAASGLASAAQHQIAQHLVARVCADASEQDHWQIRLDAPPGDPLHRLMRAAGGQHHEAEEIGGEVFMAKVLHPRALFAALGDMLAKRLRDAGFAKPIQLGLEIQGTAKRRRTHAVEVARLRLVLGSRGLKLASGSLSRNYLSLRLRDLTPLVLGHWNLADLIDAGRIEASSKAACRLGCELFPKLAWWHPPLDDLLSPG